MCAECGQNERLQSLHFELDVEKSATRVGAQDVLQLRKVDELGAPCLGHCDPLHPLVMTDHRAATGGEAHIELKTVAAVVERKAERRRSVLCYAAERTRAPMTQQQ